MRWERCKSVNCEIWPCPCPETAILGVRWMRLKTRLNLPSDSWPLGRFSRVAAPPRILPPPICRKAPLLSWAWLGQRLEVKLCLGHSKPSCHPVPYCPTCPISRSEPTCPRCQPCWNNESFPKKGQLPLVDVNFSFRHRLPRGLQNHLLASLDVGLVTFKIL